MLRHEASATYETDASCLSMTLKLSSLVSVFPCPVVQAGLAKIMKASRHRWRQIMIGMKPSCSVQRQIIRGMKVRCTLQRHIKVTLKPSCSLLLGIIMNKEEMPLFSISL
jgi:hypothetical protein